MPAFTSRARHTRRAAARPERSRVTIDVWPPSPRRAGPADGDDDLLEAANATPGDRVLVVGGDRVDILCAALRRGCRSAMGTATPERHPAPADLVLAPRISTAEQAAAIGECARRAMVQGVRSGRLAIGLLGAGAASLGRAVARRLRDYGFNRARLRAGAQGRLLLVCEFTDPAAPGGHVRKA